VAAHPSTHVSDTTQVSSAADSRREIAYNVDAVALHPTDLLLWQTKITQEWLRSISLGDALERRNQEQSLLFIEYLIEQSAVKV
jgi:hypothetical protein